MSAIPEVLQTALATKVKDEVQPVKNLIVQARTCLEAYEALFVADAERKAVGAMLAALGQPVPEPDPKLKETADIARTSLEALLVHLGKAPVVPVCVPGLASKVISGFSISPKLRSTAASKASTCPIESIDGVPPPK